MSKHIKEAYVCQITAAGTFSCLPSWKPGQGAVPGTAGVPRVTEAVEAEEDMRPQVGRDIELVCARRVETGGDPNPHRQVEVDSTELNTTSAPAQTQGTRTPARFEVPVRQRLHMKAGRHAEQPDPEEERLIEESDRSEQVEAREQPAGLRPYFRIEPAPGHREALVRAVE